jgi:hypothetical protein
VQRASTTVVVLVGIEATPAMRLLEEAANVRVLDLERDTHPLDRAVTATRQAATAHIPYLVHDADPLAVVADAWTRFFDGEGPVGELEVAVSETLARVRTGAIELPDYYLVLDPEHLDATRRHFWLGLMRRDAPGRVVPVGPEPSRVLTALATLAPGRWWSPLDELLAGIERAVPDQIGAPGPPSPSDAGEGSTARGW